MTKTTRILTVVWFVLLLAVPGVATIFSNRETIANRPVTTAPELTLDGVSNGEYFEAADSYLEDRLSVRERAIEANAAIAYEVFEDSASPSVYIGRDGYLFLAGTFELPCQTNDEGSWPEPNRVVEMTRRLDGALDDNGADLYFTIVPEKGWAYPELLPGAVPSMACTKPLLDDLRFAIADEPSYLDLFTFVLERAQTDPEALYQRTDTHWNNYGRTVASEFLVNAMAPGTYDREALVYADYVEKPDGGDLAQLLGYGVGDGDVRIATEREGVTTESIDAPGAQREWRSVSTSSLDDTASLVPGRTVIVTDSHLNTAANQLAPWFESVRIIPWQELQHESVPDEVRSADRIVLSFSARFSAERLTSFSRLLARYLAE